MSRLVAVVIVGALLLMLGFNTIDAMINQFFWSDYWRTINGWQMIPGVVWNWWGCYIIFGIVPLISGGLMLGFIVAKLTEAHEKQRALGGFE